jgi:hypothetical protein
MRVIRTIVLGLTVVHGAVNTDGGDCSQRLDALRESFMLRKNLIIESAESNFDEFGYLTELSEVSDTIGSELDSLISENCHNISEIETFRANMNEKIIAISSNMDGWKSVAQIYRGTIERIRRVVKSDFNYINEGAIQSVYRESLDALAFLDEIEHGIDLSVKNAFEEELAGFKEEIRQLREALEIAREVAINDFKARELVNKMNSMEREIQDSTFRVVKLHHQAMTDLAKANNMDEVHRMISKLETKKTTIFEGLMGKVHSSDLAAGPQDALISNIRGEMDSFAHDGGLRDASACMKSFFASIKSCDDEFVLLVRRPNVLLAEIVQGEIAITERCDSLIHEAIGKCPQEMRAKLEHNWNENLKHYSLGGIWVFALEPLADKMNQARTREEIDGVREEGLVDIQEIQDQDDRTLDPDLSDELKAAVNREADAREARLRSEHEESQSIVRLEQTIHPKILELDDQFRAMQTAKRTTEQIVAALRRRIPSIVLDISDEHDREIVRKRLDAWLKMKEQL